MRLTGLDSLKIITVFFSIYQYPFSYTSRYISATLSMHISNLLCIVYPMDTLNWDASYHIGSHHKWMESAGGGETRWPTPSFIIFTIEENKTKFQGSTQKKTETTVYNELYAKLKSRCLKNFFELCQFCCRAGVWPVILYTHWHRGENRERPESGIYFKSSRKHNT